MQQPQPQPHRIVIVGGGFGGLQTALGLRRARAQVTLVDRRNFHLFQPLLYQVATGTLSPANIASPLRRLVRRQANTEVVLGEATGIDAQARRLLLGERSLPYDTLVIAAGSQHHYFGHDAWAPHAPGLKTVEDAARMRRMIFSAFEAAEREHDPARHSALLTFVVVGAGPTGVELAGALAEIARHTLVREFRHIDTSAARIVLLEAGPRILPEFDERLAAHALRSLTGLGVEVLAATAVVSVDNAGVEVRRGATARRIPAATILWAAGVQGAPLGAQVAQATGARLDRSGRIEVAPDCTLPGHPELFVIGDLALFPGPHGPLPGVAPVAMQQGEHVARTILARLDGRPTQNFSYRDRGAMATIGRRLAVARVGRWRFSGTFAWLMWLIIHLMALVRLENRFLVLFQWCWHYLTWNRNARLITDCPPASAEEEASRSGRESS
jgi:NADH dehydrogenase